MRNQTLRHLRQSVCLSQYDVARIMGVRQSTVAMWETGKTKPRADKLIKLANLYHCSIEELLGQKGA